MQNKMFPGQFTKTAVAHKFISLRRSFQYIIPCGKNKLYTIASLVFIFNAANKNESKVASIFIRLLKKRPRQLTNPAKLQPYFPKRILPGTRHSSSRIDQKILQPLRPNKYPSIIHNTFTLQIPLHSKLNTTPSFFVENNTAYSYPKSPLTPLRKESAKPSKSPS